MNKISAWTDKEDELIKTKYPLYGSKIPELQRSERAIWARARTLGVKHEEKHYQWSKEEDELLKANYAKQGSSIHGINKPRSAIISRARTLGLKSDRTVKAWTKDELDLLEKMYPQYGCNIPQLKRSKGSICEKANQMGLKNVKHATLWTKEEDTILKEKYPLKGTDIPELAHKKGKAISSKASRLNIKFLQNIWTDEENEILKNKFPTHGAKIPELLQRHTLASTRKHAYELGIKTLPKYKKDFGKYYNNKCGIPITVKDYKNSKYEFMFKDGEKVYGEYLHRYCRIQHPTLKTFRCGAKGSYCDFTTRYLYTDTESEIWTAYYEVECQKCGLKDIMTPQQMQEHFKICQQTQQEITHTN